MYVAYSNIVEEKPVKRQVKQRANWAKKFLFKEYKKLLEDRAADIEEIQKYFPGWLPEFEY
jgi:hypothetical protein